jgi:hypothetical protein
LIFKNVAIGYGCEGDRGRYRPLNPVVEQMRDLPERTGARIVGGIVAGRMPFEQGTFAQVTVVLSAVALSTVEDNRYVRDGSEAELREPLQIWLKDLDHVCAFLCFWQSSALCRDGSRQWADGSRRFRSPFQGTDLRLPTKIATFKSFFCWPLGVV